MPTLVGHIRDDEVGHYKLFLCHSFLRYRDILTSITLGLWLRVIRQRLGEIGQEDAYLALKNGPTLGSALPDRHFSSLDFQRFQHTAGHSAPAYYPYEMTVKMLVKPLRLPGLG